jgi:hypothetical protein
MFHHRGLHHETSDVVALAPFTVYAQAVTDSLTTSDQLSLNRLAVIGQVTSANAGWIVIHAELGRSSGPVVGIAPVPDEGKTLVV